MWSGLPAGLLRVGCSADVARSLIGDGVPEFLERYPDIDLRLRIGDRLRVAGLVRDQLADVVRAADGFLEDRTDAGADLDGHAGQPQRHHDV